MSENINDYVIIEDKPQSWFNKIKQFPASYYLVAVNVLVFLGIHISNFLFTKNAFLALLLKDSFAISIHGEYYRLLTAIFTHESIAHLFFNCFALIVLSQPIEQIFGKRKFILMFIIAGLFGSLASFIFSPSYALGASGGVFGIFGIHFYLYLKNKNVYLKIFGQEILKLFLINVVIGFTVSNIDYWGHFGGVLGGFLGASSLGLTQHFKLQQKQILIGISTIILFVGSFAYFSNNYSTFILDAQPLIDQAEQAINNNDLEKLQASRDAIEELTPWLPPMPQSDIILNQLDQYIIKIEKN